MKIYILILIAVLLFSGCSEKIKVKLDDTYTRIVVEGNLTTEYKVQSVKLTKTSNYFANEQAPVYSGAIVTISNTDTLMLLTEDPANSGIYKTLGKVRGIVGKTYVLKIDNVVIDGVNKNFEASVTIKKTIAMDSITVDQFTPSHMEIMMYGLREGGNYYKINGWGQEDPTPGDFYMWDYYINGIITTDTITKSVLVDDNLVNGNYIPGMTIFVIESNPGDTIALATQSISKEYFDFVNAFITEVRSGGGGGMFSGPPANIVGNISNGGLGFFLATDVAFSYKIIK